MNKLVALVPAHNEESGISDTIESLRKQKRPPDKIVVINDNSSDKTGQIAAAYGADVFHTQHNEYKKAGGLNQALETYRFDKGDRVLVMDADSVLDEDFLEVAEERLDRGDVSAVGGTFYGQPGGGLVGMFQRNEYARYARDIDRLRGKVLVLTGTATLFNFSALDEVRKAREEGKLPGSSQVYDTRVLTEDNELTLALLHLGHKIISPKGCKLTTEVMPTWKDLAKQRLRWKRGALENLVDYGVTKVTLKYWARQALSLIGLFVIVAYLLTIVLSLILGGGLSIHPLWIAITSIFALERVVTVRRRGWKQMFIGGTLIVEMIYDIFLQGVQAVAFAQAALKSERRWS